MKNLFSQLVKLANTLLVMVTATLMILWATRAAVSITSEVLLSFTSCENRYFLTHFLTFNGSDILLKSEDGYFPSIIPLLRCSCSLLMNEDAQKQSAKNIWAYKKSQLKI